MDFERGLIRLKRRLKKVGNQHIIQRVAILELELLRLLQNRELPAFDQTSSEEIENLVNELEKIAYRFTGSSFIELCTSSQHVFSSHLFSLSLKNILMALILILLIPGFGIATASSIDEESVRFQIEDIREQIDTLEMRVGTQNVSSPFYLSNISACDQNTVRKIAMDRNIVVQLQIDETSPFSCTWVYLDEESNENGEVIVEDTFSDEEYHRLLTRTYYDIGKIIAQDTFNWSDNTCFRQRTYLDFPDFGECYNEAGELRSLTRGELLSPIPPLAYWFFYR